MRTPPSPLIPSPTAVRGGRPALVAVLVGVLVLGLIPPALAGSRHAERTRVSGLTYTRSDHDARRVTLPPSQPGPGTPAPRWGPAPDASCSGTVVPAGGDVQKALSAAPAGATVCLDSGTHRIGEALRPKARQVLAGAAGAVLSGARTVTDFRRESGRWVATTPIPSLDGGGECRADAPLCRSGADVFLDGERLERVTSAGAVTAGRVHVDTAAGRITVADDPSGRVVEISNAAQAVVGAGGVDGVVVRDLVVEKFGNAAQTGAIDDRGGDDWVIERNEIRDNHGAGVFLRSGSVLRANRILRSGQIGIAANGDGLLVEDNEIAHNNTAGFDPYWEAGGTKFAYTNGLVVRGNHAHHNNGPGLWTDIDNINTRIERNVASSNTLMGIFHEISYDAVITENTVEDNGGGGTWWVENAGIVVAHSPNVQVTNNTLRGNKGGGVALLQYNHRGSGRYGPHELKDVTVSGNVVSMPSGYSGLAQDAVREEYYTNRNLRFVGNHYFAPAGAKPFMWREYPHTTAQWHKAGHDTTGSVSAL